MTEVMMDKVSWKQPHLLGGTRYAYISTFHAKGGVHPRLMNA